MCGSCGTYLIRTNVGDPKLREKDDLLLIGSCMKDRFPDVVSEIEERGDGMVVLDVCMEEIHMNHAGFKIASIVRYANIKRLTALTIDGSPHCVQLHYVIEDIQRHFAPDVEVSHYVVEKGKVCKVSSQAVKRSRHLSKIEVGMTE